MLTHKWFTEEIYLRFTLTAQRHISDANVIKTFDVALHIVVSAEKLRSFGFRPNGSGLSQSVPDRETQFLKLRTYVLKLLRDLEKSLPNNPQFMKKFRILHWDSTDGQFLDYEEFDEAEFLASFEESIWEILKINHNEDIDQIKISFLKQNIN